MAHDTSELVVLVDEAGDHYVLTRETIEAGRVAGPSGEALRNLLEEDTGGYILPGTQYSVRQSFVIAGGLSALNARGIIVVGGRDSGLTAFG